MSGCASEGLRVYRNFRPHNLVESFRLSVFDGSSSQIFRVSVVAT